MPMQTVWGALKFGWLFRTVSIWGKETVPLYPSINESLVARNPRKGVRLWAGNFFHKGASQKANR